MISEELQKALRERYNPEGSNLRLAQKRMLEMLLFVDDFCESHHITYWIDSGTLLGAVRHGGFIPWDDDMDICMPIPDYLRFKELMINSKNPDYVLQCHDTDPNYYGTWGVVRDLHTEMEDGAKRLGGFKYKGLQIDIFPIDNRCNKKLWQISRLYFAYLINAPLFEGRVTKYIRWCVPLSFALFTKVLVPLLRFVTPSNNADLYFRYGMFWYHRFPKGIVFPLKRIQFEGGVFSAPYDVDKYLTEEYGNWREIPPEAKRLTHHFEVKFL